MAADIDLTALTPHEAYELQVKLAHAAHAVYRMWDMFNMSIITRNDPNPFGSFHKELCDLHLWVYTEFMGRQIQ